jgi:hypothetical protein
MERKTWRDKEAPNGWRVRAGAATGNWNAEFVVTDKKRLEEILESYDCGGDWYEVSPVEGVR